VVGNYFISKGKKDKSSFTTQLTFSVTHSWRTDLIWNLWPKPQKVPYIDMLYNTCHLACLTKAWCCADLIPNILPLPMEVNISCVLTDDLSPFFNYWIYSTAWCVLLRKWFDCVGSNINCNEFSCSRWRDILTNNQQFAVQWRVVW